MPTQTARSYSPEQIRRVLGKAFWGIVRFYEFRREDQAVLLGLSKNNRSPLGKLEENASIPHAESAEIIAGQLLGIHKCLGILYPRADELEGNYRLQVSFFKRPMKELGDKTPMEFSLEDEHRPISRLTTLRRILDIKRTAG